MKRFLSLGLVLALISFSLYAAERLPSEVARDQEIARLVAATKAKPKDVGSWHDLATLYREKKDWDRAIEAENKAISQHSKYAAAFYGRGMASFGRKDFEAARRDFTKAAELWEGPGGLDDFLSHEQPKPEHIEAYKMRARAWVEEGKLAPGIDDLSLCVKLRKQDADLYLERAMLREKTNLMPEAISDYRLSALLFMDRGDLTRAEEAARNLDRLKAINEYKEVYGRIQEKRANP